MNGQASAFGQPTRATRGMAMKDPIRWIVAMSRSLSWLDLTSAFQLACSSAANSTAPTTGQLSVMGRGSTAPLGEVLAKGARPMHVSSSDGSNGRLGLTKAGLGQGAGGFQDRVGDGADVRVDALQVADQVNVQRTGADALRRVVLQA